MFSSRKHPVYALDEVDTKMALHEVKLCLLGVSPPSICEGREKVMRLLSSHTGERRGEDVHREQVRVGCLL